MTYGQGKCFFAIHPDSLPELASEFFVVQLVRISDSIAMSLVRASYFIVRASGFFQIQGQVDINVKMTVLLKGYASIRSGATCGDL